MDSKEQIQTLIKTIVQMLVNKPESVSLKHWSGEQTTVFELRVDKEDVGKVIGKQGRTITAIREVLKCICGRYKLRAVLDFQE